MLIAMSGLARFPKGAKKFLSIKRPSLFLTVVLYRDRWIEKREREGEREGERERAIIIERERDRKHSYE